MLALAISVLVSACASGNRPATTNEEGIQHVTLTPAQMQVIESGVRTMVERESGMKIGSVTATRQAGKPGVHVCGYVTPPATDGKPAPTMPFYIELQEKEGKPVAERGQVGSDPSRLGKVNFVCRHNG